MTDLTGWTPHDGNGTPKFGDVLGEEELVAVLLRGKDGPRESGPAHPGAIIWTWSAGVPAFSTDQIAQDAISHGLAAPIFASGDVIAWCPEGDLVSATRYPHIRADLGQ